MTSITKIPCKIIGEVLKNLDDLNSLTSALLTCRHFHTAYCESHGVEAAIISRQITPALLPYSVVIVQDDASLSLPENALDLLDDLRTKPTSHWVQTMAALSKTDLRKMSRLHDIVHTMATEYATRAWALVPQTSSASPGLVLSPSESWRFCRAFYRVELFNTLCAGYEDGDDGMWWFLQRYPPWENEQIACVYDYLVERFLKTSRNVLAHDIYFGKRRVNYLSAKNTNSLIHKWLSHGIKFVHSLVTAGSYKAKRRLLMSHRDAPYGKTSLAKALVQLHDSYSMVHDSYDSDTSEGESISMTRPYSSDQSEDDPDTSPYDVFSSVNAERIGEEAVFLHENATLRECAYVLWDEARLRRLEHRLWEDIWGERQPEPTEEENDEMLESFEERSRIWREGGRGYWSVGNTSRIVWKDK